MKLVPNLASLGSHLGPILIKKSIFTWSDDYNIAFEKIKSETVSLTEKTHINVKLKTRVKSDGSHNGLGATLEQPGVKDWRSISLKPHEATYSANELKLLGVVWSVEHYKNFLYTVRNLKS